MAELSVPDRALWVTSTKYDGYLYIDKPPIVFAARVNQGLIVLPFVEVTYDGVTQGAFGDVLPGMTVLFGTTAGGDDLGRQRVRKAPTSTVLYVGESAYNDHDGEIAAVNDAYISVLDDRRVWAVHPVYYKEPVPISYKDYDIEVITGGRNYAVERGPKSNAGCFRAGLVDSVTDLCTFSFDGSVSLSLTTGATISTYLWDVGDGTITVGTSASSGITAAFPIGRRYISLTTTDSDGNSHTMYVLVVALSMDDPTWKPIQSFEIMEDHETELGKSMSFIITEDVSPTTYYDGVAVIYFETETYGTTTGSLAGPASAEHIKMVGWLDVERESPEATFQGIQKGVEFKVISTAERLRQIVLLPQLWIHKSSPDDWDESDATDSPRFAWYLMNWHSTVMSIADFLLPGGFDEEWKRWGTTAADLWSQVAETARARAHKLTCDKRGVLRFVGDVQVQTDEDRTSTSITTLGAADITAYTLERKRTPDLYWLDANAITIGTTKALITALFAIAPGDTPGQGAQRSLFGGLIADDQDQLNSWAGNEYARLNSPWLPLKIALMHTGDAGLDPALMEWVTVTIPSTSNRRGRSLTSQRCLVTEVNITHSNDTVHTKEVELTLWIEVPTYAASTRIVQTDGANIPPDVVVIGSDIYPVITPNPLSSLAFGASPAVYALDYNGGYIARTRTQTGSPTWEKAIQLSDLPSVLAFITHFATDSWNPKDAAYLIGSTDLSFGDIKIYYIEGLNGAAGTQTITLLHTLDVLGGAAALASSPNIQGGVYGCYVTPGSGDNRHGFFGRDGYADSFRTTAPIGVHSSFGSEGIALGYHPASDSVGRLALVGTESNLYESTTMGLAFSAVRSASAHWTCAHYPFSNNPNDMILYAGNKMGNPTDASALQRRNTDGSWSNISPFNPAPSSDWRYARFEADALSMYKIHTYTQNRMILSVIGTHPFYGHFLYNSDNGGDNWNAPIQLYGTPTGVGGWPNDPNVLFLFGDVQVTSGGSDGIWWTDDRGVSWNNMIGDWTSSIGAFNGIRNLVPIAIP